MAAPLADLAWAVLLLLGVERATLVPGARGPGGVEQVFVPYSHSLAATALRAAAAYAAVRLLPPGRPLRLGALFPANVHAARARVDLEGKPATPLWFRAPVQALFIGLLLWATW